MGTAGLIQACDNCGDEHAKLFRFRRRAICRPCKDNSLEVDKTRARYIEGANIKALEDVAKVYNEELERVKVKLADMEDRLMQRGAYAVIEGGKVRSSEALRRKKT